MTSKCTDFELLDQDSKSVKLSEVLQQGPVMLVFYPGDFTPVCTTQLCGYRDAYAEFQGLGVQILGISPDAPEKHRQFIDAMKFPFSLLSDPQKKVFKDYGMTFLFGMAGRGNVLISRSGEIRYRHNEAVPITHRKKDELLQKIKEIF